MEKRLWTKNFILLAAGNLFMCIGFYFLMPSLPVYVVDVLKAHKSDVGYILAVYTISAILIRPFAGMMLDRWGRKWIYGVSFFLFSLCLTVYPLAGSFLALLFLRFFHGFAWGVTTTANSTIVVDIIPASKRGRGIGYFGASFTVAMALGPMVALWILGFSGFTGMFLAASVISFLGLVLVLAVDYPPFQPARNATKLSWDRIVERSSLPMTVPHMLYGMTYGGVVSFITLYAREMNIDQVGTFFFILAAGIFISRLITGQIFDRNGPYWLMMAGFGTTIPGFLILGFSTTTTGLLLAAFLIGIGSGIIMPTITTMVNNVVTTERRGAANATITTAFDLGIGMGSLFLGLLSDYTGLANMFLFCVLILAGGLVYYLGYVNRFYHERRIQA